MFSSTSKIEKTYFSKKWSSKFGHLIDEREKSEERNKRDSPKDFPFHSTNFDNKDINIYREAIAKLGLTKDYYILYNKAVMTNGKPLPGCSSLYRKNKAFSEGCEQLLALVGPLVIARHTRERKAGIKAYDEEQKTLKEKRAAKLKKDYRAVDINFILNVFEERGYSISDYL